MKATNAEIQKAKDVLMDMFTNAEEYAALKVLCEAADETIKYRDALRFRSFDESLKNDRPYNRFTGPWVELKDEEGRVYRCLHSGDAESYSRKGYTGWRYPVGDLVGGGE